MTLTEASFWTKRFGVIAAGAVVVATVVVLVVTVERKQEMPPQYLQANFACTDTREEFLPYKLDIPSLSLASGSEAIFDIQTDSGKIDSLPQIINLYKFNNPTQSLTAQLESKELASKLGFDPDEIIRKGTEKYIWTNKEFGKTLEIQTKNLNFTLQTDTDRIREITSNGTLPSEQEAKALARNFVNSVIDMEDDYSSGTYTTMYVSINPDGTLSEVTSRDQAELIRVDFNREKSMITIPTNIVGAEDMVTSIQKTLLEPEETVQSINGEKIEVYTFNTPVTFVNPSDSNISVYIGAEDKELEDTAYTSIYVAEIVNWPIEADSCGTYELISPYTAIEKVQAGLGSLVYLNTLNADDLANYIPKTVKKFTILYVNITYLETPEEQEYLQPVYVISGEAILENDVKANFDYYYPAINYDIVQDKIILEEPEIVEKSGFF